ncbi:MAG: DUF2251 domain-containing protein [Syntrophobacteraceae bacterium]|nr:DUF2251 domain-containing protein [Syntrophobacteraceae bacterium]
MAIQVVAEQEYLVGTPTMIEGPAPKGPFMAVFEDDGDTGFFYALDTGVEGNPLQDAVHIYNSANVTNREKPVLAVIGWSIDNKKAVLLINDYPHAIFDFDERQGYCRTGFPPPNPEGKWSKGGHSWEESAVALFT